MQHSDADRTMAPERYLLGEITGPELDDFEEHMFVCVECAEAVKAGARFTETARAVFREHPELAEAEQREQKRESSSARTAFFWKWFSFPQLATSFAAVCLLFFSGYQYMENMRLMRGMASLIAQPSGQESYSLVPEARSGSSEQAKAIPAGVNSFVVELQQLPDHCNRGCMIRARDSRGHYVPELENVMLPPSLDGKASLNLSRALLAPGSYTILVTEKGTSQPEVYSVQL